MKSFWTVSAFSALSLALIILSLLVGGLFQALLVLGSVICLLAALSHSRSYNLKAGIREWKRVNASSEKREAEFLRANSLEATSDNPGGHAERS